MLRRPCLTESLLLELANEEAPRARSCSPKGRLSPCLPYGKATIDFFVHNLMQLHPGLVRQHLRQFTGQSANGVNTCTYLSYPSVDAAAAAVRHTYPMLEAAQTAAAE